MTTTINSLRRETVIQMRQTKKAVRGRAGMGEAATLALAAMVLAGCDVTNPGPVQDSFLNEPAAYQALVNGSGRQLSLAISSIGYAGALSAREIMPGGQTGSGGHSANGQAGVLIDNEVRDEWSHAQQARWIAEDAIRRFTKVVTPDKVDPLILSTAYLYDGFALRTLGENMCDAVIDGGPKEPYTKYFDLAQAAFANAIAKAPATAAGTTVKQAAYVGRAAVRAWLKDWTGAAADAALVPASFGDYNIPISLDDIKQNGDDLYWANQNSPYRGYSVWKTWFEGYYDQTGDARAAYAKSAAYPLAQQQLTGYGAVPWEYATSPHIGLNHRIASYAEAQLIQAEAALNSGDIATAMGFINKVHTAAKSTKTGQALAPLATPANITDAWTLLKREREVEFWLESRRFADLRRWAINKTPGDIDWPNFESVSTLFKNTPSSCFPISDTEVNSNPNLS
jgi:hypothetical protein